MDLEGIMLSEITEVQKDKYHGFHSSVKSKKIKNKNKLTGTEIRLVATRGEGGWEEGEISEEGGGLYDEGVVIYYIIQSGDHSVVNTVAQL